MKGWIAHGYMESIVGFDHASEDILRFVLSPKGDFQPVEFTNLPCRFEGPRIDIDAGEAPAVFALASQRVNQACTGADV